jgi:ketosteroid isomerase-like protein
VEGDVEVVRRIYASGCWDSAGDPHAADELLGEEVEFVNPADAVAPGTRRGRAGFAAAMANPGEAFEWWAHEPLSFRDRGPQVLVEVIARVRGRATGIEMSHHEWHVWTVRDGVAVRVEWFKDRDLALASTGAQPA